jgi:hypothetical protein
MTTEESPATTTKPWYKKWWIWALVALGVLIIAAALSSTSDEDPAAVSTTTSTAGDTTTTTTTETTTTTAATTTTTETTTTTAAYLTFGDGTWIVGDDVEPEIYRNDDSSDLCFWERLSGFSGELEDTIANDVTEEVTIVEISESDSGFSSQDCGTWSKSG